MSKHLLASESVFWQTADMQEALSRERRVEKVTMQEIRRNIWRRRSIDLMGSFATNRSRG
jgi:hypothetical protein